VSCIAGLFNRSGAPLEPSQLEQMLLPMRPRAPDGEQIFCRHGIGLAQLLLRTGTSGAEAAHVISGDDDLWIVADARIDGRAELVRKLRSRGCEVSSDAPHALLVLQAYCSFGEKFLDHLIGDFAFAIWDARKLQLICGRDHFGVRPFHYFDSGDVFAFASDVDAVLAWPKVSNELDEVSVADFLLFGSLQDQDRTIYRDIRCLPPASMMTVTAGEVSIHRYWQMPVYPQIRFSKHADYVREYGHVFEQAVADRLPEGPVALQLSGGIDSAAIAAMATTLSRPSARRIEAYTFGCRTLVANDDEGRYANMAASHLGISWREVELGNYSLFERSQEQALHLAEPLMYPFLAAQHDILQSMGRTGAKVVFSGQGGDALMTPSAAYYRGLLRNGRFVELIGEVAHHFRHTGSLAGMGLRSAISPPARPVRQRPPVPDWIESAFGERVGLQARWERGWRVLHDGLDPYTQLNETWLCRQFEMLEAVKLPVVARYPFYDLRLVEFSLGMPNFMRKDKRVVRLAMRDKLPTPILDRPKFSLPGDFVRAIVTRGNEQPTLLESLTKGLPPPLNSPKYRAALEHYGAGKGAESAWTSSLIITGLAFRNWQSQR
jgi:asparagine synthase (glutamine-hydrolysing)